MNGRAKRILIFAGIFVLVFLAGFLPEYVRANRLQDQLDEARREQEFCRVRDLLGMTFLETSLKNYGVAGRYSTEFFNAAKTIAGRTSSPELRQTLQEALSKRDAITAQLARADGSAYNSVQSVYQSVLERAVGASR